MTLNGVMAVILRYVTELMYDVVVESLRPLSHLLMSFLYILSVTLANSWQWSEPVAVFT